MRIALFGFLPQSVKKKLNKLSIYAFPVISGVVILILMVGIILPRVQAVFTLRKEISQLKQKVEAMDKKLVTLRGFNQNLLADDVKKVEIALPSEKDLSSILSNLESLAAETGVAIAGVQTTPGEVKPASGKGETDNLPVKVTITGDFGQIKSFLGRLVSASRLMSAESLAVSANPSATTASLSASLDLAAYFQIPTVVQFNVDEPVQTLNSEEEKILTKITPATIPPSAAPPVTGRSDPFAAF